MATPTPMLRAGLLDPVAGLLAHGGVDARKILRKHGFSQKTLENPYTLIPLRAFVRLCEDAASVTGDGAFGLHVGQRMTPEQHGPAGFFFGSEPTLRGALTRYGEYMSAWQDGTLASLARYNDASAFLYRIADHRIQPRRQDAELTISAIHRQLTLILGRNWAPVEVHFEHAAPDELKSYRAIFRAPVYFNAPVNRLVIEDSDLDRPHLAREENLSPFLTRHLSDLKRQRGGASLLSQQVEEIIVAKLGEASLDLPIIADELGLSPRTLQRRLSEEGVSYRALLENVRRRIAEATLGEPHARVIDVAASLGYGDSAVLSRAFKRWTGTSPRRFARKHR
jgi:AraC-like DNA-binding protein